MRQALIRIVRGYRYFISPLLGPRCRFYPTCSEYALTAIEAHGVCKGVRLACWRLLRCHPWHSGGYDPVPAGTSCNEHKAGHG
ncbi:MAG: membrane protein insertion efficiency factor YidD [Acidiferrobacterales bacterium]